MDHVVQVLQLLATEVKDVSLRQQAEQWLLDFQKAQHTTSLALEILRAALIPNLASDSSISQFGRVQPAVQQQLLFFLAQTLNVKLKREISKFHAGRPLEAPPLDPSELLLMAREARRLPHKSLSRCLALAAGQVSVLSEWPAATSYETISLGAFLENLHKYLVGNTTDIEVRLNSLKCELDQKPEVDWEFDFYRGLAKSRDESVRKAFIMKVIEGPIAQSIKLLDALDPIIEMINRAHIQSVLCDGDLHLPSPVMNVGRILLDIMMTLVSIIQSCADELQDLIESLVNAEDLMSHCVELVMRITDFVLRNPDMNFGRLTRFLSMMPNASEFVTQLHQAIISCIDLLEPMFGKSRTLKEELESTRKEKRRNSLQHGQHNDRNYEAQLSRRAHCAASYAWQVVDIISAKCPNVTTLQEAMLRLDKSRSVYFLQNGDLTQITSLTDNYKRELDSVVRFEMGHFEFSSGHTPHPICCNNDEEEENLFSDLITKSSEPLQLSRVLRACVALDELCIGFTLGQLCRYFGRALKCIAPAAAVAILFSEVGNSSLDSARPVQNVSCHEMTAMLVAQAVDMTVDVRGQSEEFPSTASPLKPLHVALRLLLEPRRLRIPKDLKTIFECLRRPWTFETVDGYLAGWTTQDFENGAACGMSGLKSVCELFSSFAKRAEGILRTMGFNGMPYAPLFRDTILTGCGAIGTYPWNFELLSVPAREQWVTNRDEGRRIAKLVTRVLPMSNYQAWISEETAKAVTLTCPDQNLSNSQMWKKVEALFQMIAIVSGSEMSHEENGALQALSNETVMKLVLSHRGALRSLLWLLAAPGIQGSMSEAFLNMSLCMCRIALRLPQNDPIYPMSSNEDHLGVVTLNKIGSAFENCPLEHCDYHDLTEFAKETLYNVSLSCGENPPMALSSLPLMIYGLGQVLTALRVNNIQCEIIQELATMLTTCIVNESTVEVIIALMNSVNSAVSSFYPIEARPFSKCLADLGVKRSLKGWAQEIIGPSKGDVNLILRCRQAAEKVTPLYWSTVATMIETIASPCADLAIKRNSPALIDAFADLLAMLFALPSAGPQGFKMSTLELTFQLAESKASCSGLYKTALPLLDSAALEWTLGRVEGQAEVAAHVSDMIRLTHLAVVEAGTRFIQQIGNDINPSLIARRAEALLTVFQRLARQGISGEMKPRLILALLSQSAAASTILGSKIDEAGLEHLIPLASFQLVSNLAEDRNRSALLMPLFNDHPDLQMVLANLIATTQIHLAAKGASRPIPLVNGKLLNDHQVLSSLPGGVWVLAVGLLLQTVMIETPMVSQKSLHASQTALIELLVTLDSHGEVEGALTATKSLIVACLPGGKLHTCPMKWASSNENFTIFINELTRRLKPSVMPASEAPPRGEKTITRRVSDPGVENSEKSILQDPLMMTILRKILRRNCALVNVAKRSPPGDS